MNEELEEQFKKKSNGVPCGDRKYETCFDCPKFDEHECKLGYCLDKYLVKN